MNLSKIAKQLAEAGIEDAARDVRKLFDHAYEGGQGAPEPQTRDTPNDMTLELFEIAVSERLKRKPVSQIIGRRAFWRHDFEVTPDVLDPRPDTETLVAAALTHRFTRVLDLGTGSGCILLSLLAERPGAQGLGVDLSPDALNVARRNATRVGVERQVNWLTSDWFENVTGAFDLIVSNPPYIATHEMAALDPEVREHEPRLALTDDGDGLGAYRIICDRAAAFLHPGGRLMVEIGPTQAGAVCALMHDARLQGIAVLQDLDGRDRVVQGQLPA